MLNQLDYISQIFQIMQMNLILKIDALVYSMLCGITKDKDVVLS